MKKLMLSAASLSLLTFGAPAAIADAKSDAEFIASVLQSDEVLAVQLQSLKPLLQAQLENTLRQSGVQLSSQGSRKLSDLFIAEFNEVFADEMRAGYVKAHLAHMRDSDISALKAFLLTDAGKRWGASQADILSDISKFGEQAGQLAGLQVGVRISERLRTQGEQLFEADDLRKLRSIF